MSIKEGYRIRFLGDGIVIHSSLNVTLKNALYHNSITISCLIVLGETLEIKKLIYTLHSPVELWLGNNHLGSKSYGSVTLKDAHWIQKCRITPLMKFNKSDKVVSEYKRGLKNRIHGGWDSGAQIMQCNPRNGSKSWINDLKLFSGPWR